MRSRVSWPAILAGSVLALAAFFLLTLVGSVAGLTVPNDIRAETLTTLAGIYAVVSIVASLFAGGYAASMLTAGESKNEGVVYGILVWATTLSLMMLLAAAGVKAGFNGVVSLATAGKAATDSANNSGLSREDVRNYLQRGGVSKERLDEIETTIRNAPEKARDAANDPETQRKAEEAKDRAADVATRVGLFAFLGVLASLLAAAFGGLYGAGLKVFSVDVNGGSGKKR